MIILLSLQDVRETPAISFTSDKYVNSGYATAGDRTEQLLASSVVVTS